jgi:hypothetical protein
MALANYTDLQASIAAWSHRSDLTAIIPDFIVLAEKRINSDIDARAQDSVVTLSTVANVAYITAPTDMLTVRSLTLVTSNQTTVLDYLTPDQFNTSYGTTTGQPQSFTIIGNLLYLGQIPDSVYSIQCIYTASVPPIASNPTNWLITNFPQVYLTACLVEVARYTLNNELFASSNASYKEAIDSVNSIDWYSGSTMRVRHDVRV